MSIWSIVAPIAGRLLDKVLPDTAEKDRLKLQYMTDMQLMIEQQNLEQIKVNRYEARSGNIFLAGWRPTIGWVGAIAFLLTALKPLFDYLLVLNGLPVLPVVGSEELTTILYGMLGLGGMRSFDKMKKIETTVFEK